MIDNLLPHAASLLSAFLGHWSQHDRLLRLHTPLEGALLVEGFTGHEALGEHYRFEITALSTDAHLDIKALLGQPVLLELLTGLSRTDLRPFHGHVTQIEAVGANGGLARYKLCIEPWTTFLTLNRDSALYQDMTVFEIFDSLFKSYRSQGRLAPAWRLDLADARIYPQRSLTTQYQESDWAFIERLMDEEGLFYFYEHHGDAASPTRGQHTLVIADHNGAFIPNAQPAIDFTQPGAVMKRDSMDRWRREKHWHTTGIERRSWDYRRLSTRAVAAPGTATPPQGIALIHQDTPGHYAYPASVHGQRRADRQMEALEAHHARFIGAGTVRTLAPGTTFTLNGHADDSAAFTVVRVAHRAYNNLRAEVQSQVIPRLGAPVLQDDATHAGQVAPMQGADTRPDAPRALYRNRLDALPGAVPYRTLPTDAQGRPRHPKPRLHGMQTAIVVGPPGQALHTDRDHRIKVQFHWCRAGCPNAVGAGMRGNRPRHAANQHGSHSRLTHPHADRDGYTGAPADHTSGTWVRVATPLAPIAGANWGSHALPRIGQEVLIDFVEGDIDRPVVVGSLYNGRGQDDAQHNQVGHGAGSATGNAPAWFPTHMDVQVPQEAGGRARPGETDGHAHAAALSGIKSQALASSQAGHGAYNQLVFDDSPGQGRTVLQHHTQPHQGSAELNLGHLRHQSDNQRLASAGRGAELKTPHSAALRAGAGLLLSTDARRHASSTQLDSREAIAAAEHSHQLQTALAGTAQKHHAQLPGEPAAEKLPAIAQMQHSMAVVNSTADHGTGHPVTAYSEPHLQLSSPAGIAATTAVNAILTAGHTSSLTAQDINLTAQGGSYHLVKDGISLFTYGQSSNKNTPHQETGIKLHAASGKVSAQAQSGPLKITADKTVTVASITQGITLAAKQHVLLTAGGAYIKLAGGNIEIHGPGAMAFKAGMRERAGPAGSTAALPNMPKALSLTLPEHQTPQSPKFSQQFDFSEMVGAGSYTQANLTHAPVTVTTRDGKFVTETCTNAEGVTSRIFTEQPADLVAWVGDGDWHMDEEFEVGNEHQGGENG